jgi:hypothetical protein
MDDRSERSGPTNRLGPGARPSEEDRTAQYREEVVRTSVEPADAHPLDGHHAALAMSRTAYTTAPSYAQDQGLGRFLLVAWSRLVCWKLS